MKNPGSEICRSSVYLSNFFNKFEVVLKLKKNTLKIRWLIWYRLRAMTQVTWKLRKIKILETPRLLNFYHFILRILTCILNSLLPAYKVVVILTNITFSFKILSDIKEEKGSSQLNLFFLSKSRTFRAIHRKFLFQTQ